MEPSLIRGWEWQIFCNLVVDICVLGCSLSGHQEAIGKWGTGTCSLTTYYQDELGSNLITFLLSFLVSSLSSFFSHFILSSFHSPTLLLPLSLTNSASSSLLTNSAFRLAH